MNLKAIQLWQSPNFLVVLLKKSLKQCIATVYISFCQSCHEPLQWREELIFTTFSTCVFESVTLKIPGFVTKCLGPSIIAFLLPLKWKKKNNSQIWLKGFEVPWSCFFRCITCPENTFFLFTLELNVMYVSLITISKIVSMTGRRRQNIYIFTFNQRETVTIPDKKSKHNRPT